jgi:hypothetical protein
VPSLPDALKHGLTARTAVVLHSESEQLYQQRLDDLFARFLPADTCESLLVEEMAAAQWRLRRAWTFETSLIHAAILQNDAHIGQTFDQIDQASRAGSALKHLTGNSNALSAIHRQATANTSVPFASSTTCRTVAAPSNSISSFTHPRPRAKPRSSAEKLKFSN